jgi:acyl-[acyl carrier protein]--UDP-N-acetylglucosamine O-acyltransferase
MAQIHPTAIVEDGAQLGADVTVGAYSIIHKNVQLGDGSIIGSHCEIGVPTPRANGKKLVIGNGAHIRSHSVFYAGSTFGEGLVTGHRVCVREGTQAGAHLQIGTASEIQGDCTLGECVRMQSNILIARHSIITRNIFLVHYPLPTSVEHLVGVAGAVRIGETVFSVPSDKWDGNPIFFV